MQLNQDLTKAQLYVVCQFTECEQSISWQLFDPQGKLIIEQKDSHFMLKLKMHNYGMRRNLAYTR